MKYDHCWYMNAVLRVSIIWIAIIFLIINVVSEERYCKNNPEDCECVDSECHYEGLNVGYTKQTFSDCRENKEDTYIKANGEKVDLYLIKFVCNKYQKKNPCQLWVDRGYITKKDVDNFEDWNFDEQCICEEYGKELLYKFICIPRYVGMKNFSMSITVKNDDELQIEKDRWWWSKERMINSDTCAFMDVQFINEIEDKENCLKAREKVCREVCE